MLEVGTKPHIVLLNDDPYPGRVTLVYSSDQSLTAKTMVLPKREFIAACSAYADVLAEEAASVPSP